MIYKFHAYGHLNVLATHKTTLEFTKDEDLSLKGNCIIGVNSDFDLSRLQDFIKKANNKKITITIETPDKKIKEIISAELNPGFSHDRELVIRKADFLSGRTLATKANKAAFEINKGLISFLKEKKNKIAVIIKNNDL